MEEDNMSSQHPAQPAKTRRWPHDLHKPGSWVVIGLVLLLLLIVALVGLKPKVKNNSAKPNFQAQVQIKADGFNPVTLSVKKGTLVSWVNQDSHPHEVAADPYPKNNSITGFDSTVILQKSDSYSFKFNKSGSYHYHDQLNPFKLTGTINVK